MIRVLVVDDSPVARQILEYILSQDPEISVIGTAGNGEEALRFMEHTRPDIITMDITMPRMDGFVATRRIMETVPVPILIVTGNDNVHEVATSFRAMEAGAVAILPRPKGIGHPEFAATAKALVEAVKIYSEISVVRRYPRREDLSSVPPKEKAKVAIEPRRKRVRIVAIGASTGARSLSRKSCPASGVRSRCRFSSSST